MVGDAWGQVVDVTVTQWVSRLAGTGVHVTVTPAAIAALAARTSTTTGAASTRTILRTLDLLAIDLVTAPSGTICVVDVTGAGDLTLTTNPLEERTDS